MAGRLHELLQQEHARFDELLCRALARPEALDRQAYASFRRGLLRHIGMEEKLLIPEARRLGSPDSLRLVAQLRADHAALAALVVPTPTREIIGLIEDVLREHNPLEEDPGGLYEMCERVGSAALEERVEELRRFPEVPAAAHSDDPRVHARVERLLRARRVAGGALPVDRNE